MNIIEKLQVKHFHSSRQKRRKDNHAGAQGWTSREAQHARFEAIASSLDFNDMSVLDVGCGMGDFNDFLDRRFRWFDYIGVDQQQEFIETAKRRYEGRRNTWFHLADFTRCQMPEVDVVVASGTFSYRCDNQNYYMEMVRHLYASANRAFIFNMLDRVFFESGPMIVSHHRGRIYEQCRELCSETVLKTSYLENDFTIVMSKKNA